MRVPAAAVTAAASFALLGSAWHLGASPTLLAPPVAVGTVSAAPVTTEPAPSEPVRTEPVATEPVATEPVATEPVATEPVATEPVATEPVATEPVATEPVVVTAPTPSTTPTPPPPPAPVTVDGAVVPTRFGDVQVQVVVQDGVLLDVVPLQLTDADDRSRGISAAAAPRLRQAVLQAQSAQVDTVSSATYTSEAYLQSLQSALDAAAGA
ncbi:FMN-binding protein [Jannaschia sp. R86511]|uniref:FMN-binding protein n=1 Tax=Jannaschia sp. R86511 TaxID=3093853 RepID=UPI0036D2BE83